MIIMMIMIAIIMIIILIMIATTQNMQTSVEAMLKELFVFEHLSVMYCKTDKHIGSGLVPPSPQESCRWKRASTIRITYTLYIYIYMHRITRLLVSVVVFFYQLNV